MVYSNYSPNGNNIEINTEFLSTGTYVSRIFTQGKISVEKFEKIK